MARGNVAQIDVLGLIAEYGSIRKAAAATGISKSTLYDQSRGLSGAATKTVQAVQAAVTDATKSLTNLIAGLAGGQQTQYREAAKTVARQQRSDPALVQQQLTTLERIQRAAGTNADGTTAGPDLPARDSLDRPIRESQDAAYRDLLARYEAGQLGEGDYGRFQAYQLGSGSGGSGVDIAPLYPE